MWIIRRGLLVWLILMVAVAVIVIMCVELIRIGITWEFGLVVCEMAVGLLVSLRFELRRVLLSVRSLMAHRVLISCGI